METGNPGSSNAKSSGKSYKKPPRPCLFCKQPETRLKRHILSEHRDEPRVKLLLALPPKEQDIHIGSFRREAIRNLNLDMVKSGKNNFLRERVSLNSEQDVPVMCSACHGFFAKDYKARHQLICSGSGSGLMLPMINIADCPKLNDLKPGFKDLLSTMRMDKIGDYVKTDNIILMIGARTHNALKRKKDKEQECKKTVRSRMRLIARVYLKFLEYYQDQSVIILDKSLNNSADMFRRETITILGEAVNTLCDVDCEELPSLSIIGQKSGLKIGILNMIKLAAKYLMGYFLVNVLDERAKSVTDFLIVLKLFEDDYFGDAYYDINFRRNVHSKKPINLPKDADVELLLVECESIFNSVSTLDHPSSYFVGFRFAVATHLIIFNARRGGEPVRLQIYQWHEALNGEWVELKDHPEEYAEENMLITYQTGKGADHLVPIIFTRNVIKAMRLLTNPEIRKEAGVRDNNPYVFPSTNNSLGHVEGWHCINYILEKISLKGAVNATKNRHRVASLLAKIKMSEVEQDLVFKHFGHSKRINETIYQAPAGSLQLNSTGKHLQSIHAGSSLSSPAGQGNTSSHCDFVGSSSQTHHVNGRSSRSSSRRTSKIDAKSKSESDEGKNSMSIMLTFLTA